MTYYFPSFVESMSVSAAVPADLKFTVNSGKNALKLLLRNLSLPKDSKIAIPAYVCAAVTDAVKEEGLEPVLFDLYPETYWTNYEEVYIIQNHVRALVLVHLHGFLHPDTSRLTEFCLKNNIKLIHDAAQSYGIDESLLLRANGVLYSFGAGKTLTGAGGGWLKGISEEFYKTNCKGIGSDRVSKNFLQHRIYGHKQTLIEKIVSKLFPAPKENDILKMSRYAIHLNSYILANLSAARIKRKNNYEALRTAVKNVQDLVIPYDDQHGQYYKVVVLTKGDPTAFKKHLVNNYVPYFCLGDHIGGTPGCNNYNTNKDRIIEISCEACLPTTEIIRVAQVLRNFH